MYISRRAFVTKIIPIAAGAAALAACGGGKEGQPISLTPTATRPSAPDQTQKAELGIIAEDRLKKITDVLINSSSPFLSKIGKDVMTLHTSTQVPSEFPEWVNPQAFPLQITTDEQDYSYVDFPFTASGDPNDQFYYDVPNKGRGQSIYFNKPGVGFHIHLGLHPLLAQKNGLIAEGILLAKEQISLTLSIQLAKEFHSYLQTRGIHLYDLSGNEIVDSKRKQQLGASMCMIEFNNPESNMWKIVDEFPVFLVGSTLLTLADHKEFPEESFGLTPFVKASQMTAADVNLGTGVQNFADKWMKNGTLLPHDGALSDVTQKAIFDRIIELNQFMYQSKISPLQKSILREYKQVA